VPSVFADSSALVKLYADEAGCEQVRALHSPLVCQLVRVEVPAAIWRKRRMGELSAAAASILVADFEADYFGTHDQPARFVSLTLRPDVLDAASRLAGVHGLRAYDAIQLATACAAAMAVPDCRTFAAFDNDLRAAAATEGFRLLPD
jgi:uncharacterized protein